MIRYHAATGAVALASIAAVGAFVLDHQGGLLGIAFGAVVGMFTGVWVARRLVDRLRKAGL